MKHRFRFFLLFAVAAATALILPRHTQAQSGQRITCSSDDGKRNWCDVGGSRNVTLTRQISGSSCIQGSTWGVDNRGVWVDRGCRAEFTIGGGGYQNSWSGQSGTVNCASNDGKRNWCDIGGNRNVTLTRQISGTACIEGSTWGVDNRGLWVDRGCRAEFTVGGGGYQNSWSGQSGTVNCSSNDGKRNWCDIGGNRNVTLTRQISGTPCIEGSTWGVDNRGLWVDRGCRAEFAVGRGGNQGSWSGQGGRTVNCASNDGKRNWCSVGGSRNIRLSRQISGTPCIEGDTWGVDNRGIWVDRGCRADFIVR